jgi:hypothetical protein
MNGSMFAQSCMRIISTSLLCACVCQVAWPQSQASSLPHLVEKDGRHALIVDGEPFLILAAQSHNSSTWPAMMPWVWPAMEFMHVNTLEIPIYWEQFEPEPGKYDYSMIDMLLEQAREHDVRLILLWFATWKNGSNHYMPQWMKLDYERYPNMIGRDGKSVDSPSPHSQATLEADKQAFAAFMRHLNEADPQHTVIMVQVENEPGSWNTVRDFSPAAQKLFESPVPAEALAAMKMPADPNVNWQGVFGKDADEFFQVWHVAKFIGEVAAAGKAEYPLPLYANASVRDPINPPYPPTYQVGGPNDNVIELWKAAAPAIDILAPDIYARETDKYLKLLDFYALPSNPLLVPETIGRGPHARFLFAALGRGAIGYGPFGMDLSELPPDTKLSEAILEKAFSDTALNYRVLAPMARELARLNFEGKLQAASEGEVDSQPKKLVAAPTSQGATKPAVRLFEFDGWSASIAYGKFNRLLREPKEESEPLGRVLVAQLAENQFLVTGRYCRVGFFPTGEAEGRPWHYLAVEEGQFENGQFVPRRILNGDETDWGIIVGDRPVVLRVTLYTR